MYHIDEDSMGVSVRGHDGNRVLLIRTPDDETPYIATSSFVPSDPHQARMFLRTCLEAVEVVLDNRGLLPRG